MPKDAAPPSAGNLEALYRAPMMTSILAGMPKPPPADLDPYLDAAAKCFARYGIARTSVQDVAKEMGYNRATVYRKVGTVDAMSRLLFARDVDRFLATLTERDWEPPVPEMIVELIASTVEYIRAHPVIAKILADEVDSAANMLAKNLGFIHDHFIAGFTPPIEIGMQIGLLAQRNPIAVAEWVFRMLVTSVVLPPTGDLREMLRELFIPVLTPEQR